MSGYSYEKNVRMDYFLQNDVHVENKNENSDEQLLFDSTVDATATSSSSIERIVDNIWNDVNETDWLGLPTTSDELASHLADISSNDALEIYNVYKKKHGETLFDSIITEYGLPIDERIRYCKNVFNKMANNAIENGLDKESAKSIQKEFYKELEVQKSKFGPADADQLNVIASKLKSGSTVKKEKTPKNPEYNYRLGSIEDSIRIVDTDSISSKVNAGPNFPDKSEQIVSISHVFNKVTIGNGEKIDNYFGSSTQGMRGDCYLLASINAIRNTDKGQEILRQNIKHNNDGSYTVTLPGALEVKKHYEPICKQRGIECDITGIYKITSAAVEKATTLMGSSYSSGDMDVVLLEIAMENYRRELSFLCDKLHIDGDFGTVEGSQPVYGDVNDYLSGGWASDSMFILTGKKCKDIFRITRKDRDNVKLYEANKYPRISRKEFDRKFKNDTDVCFMDASADGMKEYEYITYNKSNLDKLIDCYSGREGEYALTFSVIVAENGPDGSTKAGGGHELTVVKITSDNVYVANPWHPDEIEIIPRQDFIAMSTGFAATEM